MRRLQGEGRGWRSPVPGPRAPGRKRRRSTRADGDAAARAPRGPASRLAKVAAPNEPTTGPQHRKSSPLSGEDAPGALTAERSHRPLGQDRLTRAGGPNAAGDSGLKPVLTGRSEDPRPLRLTLSLLCPGCRNGAMSRMAARPPAAALAEGCKRTAEADCSGKRCLSQYARSLPRLWSPKSSDRAGREGGHLHAPAHGARPAALGPGAIPTLRPYYLRNAFRKAAAATGSDSSGGAGCRGLKTF